MQHVLELGSNIVEYFIVFLIFLVLRHDSCNDSLSIPHRVLTLANCLNWIFKVFTLPQKLCKPALLLMHILVGLPQTEGTALKQFMA